MTICNKCGAEMADNLNFCTRCGNKLSPSNNLSATSGGKYSTKKSKTKKIFKRVLFALIGILVIIFLWGSHLINSTTYLTLNSQGELFPKGGGASVVNIDYDGYIWEITYKPNWLKVNDTNNGINLFCDPNTSGIDREDHITIKSGKIIQSLYVGQFGKAQYMRISDNSVKSDTKGIRKRIKMETDATNPEIVYPEFCQITDKTPEGFTLIIPENNDFSRSGNLYVKEDDVSVAIFIQQKGKCRDCNGKGNKNCMACGGIGAISSGYYFMNCYACNGNGSVPCYSCGGAGIR